MPTLKEKLDRLHEGASCRYDDLICDLTMDGCGSFCDACSAFKQGVCRGCTKCDFMNSCPSGGCAKCAVRCGQREDLAYWENVVDGFLFDKVRCEKVFDGSLPFYVPQVKDTTHGVPHPAYLLSFSRLVKISDGGVMWLFTRKNLREAYKIPPEAKIIVHFYARDDLLELIWAYGNGDWGKGKNFWERLASYGIDGAISVNYSCFSNHPRMEHHVNMKRNVMTAEILSKAGIPVIFDLMYHSDEDLDKLLLWGQANNIAWYAINTQTLKKASWSMDMVCRVADKVLKIPNTRLLVNGIVERSRIMRLSERFGNRVSVANFAFLQVERHCRYDISVNKWIRSEKSKAILWKDTIELYESFGSKKNG